ncbi:MAG: lycopene cyclase family protein [Fibrobacterota bacterium]
MSSEIYDVAVCGAGPAGLALAAEAARAGLSVVIFEKNIIGKTKKTWLTFRDTLKRNSLSDAALSGFSKVSFSCYLGARYEFNDPGFIVPVDEEKFLVCLGEKVAKEGGEIKENECFISYREKERDVYEVVTSRGKYLCRALFDTMGRKSSLMFSLGLRNETMDMGCLAWFLEGGEEKENEMILYDSFFPGNDYFWLVPLEKGRYMAGVFFFYSLTKVNFREKEHILSEYIKFRKTGGRVYDVRYGNIPLGGQSCLSHKNIYFFGDTANTPMPSSGFSINRCLDDSKVAALFLKDVFEGNKAPGMFKKNILGPKIPAIEVHLMISDMLSKFTDPMLNKAIERMNGVSEKFIISFLTGDDMGTAFSVTALKAILSTFSVNEIRSLSLKQNYFRNISNLYNLIPAITSAKIGEILNEFIRDTVKRKYPFKKDI